MATKEDAEAGWQFFKESNYALRLDEINERLIRHGFAPVSQRTYQHYGKLHRYGYENYLPINQLDVKTLQNPIWDAAVRNRYVTHQTRLPVTLRVLRDDFLTELEGEAVVISEGIVVVRLSGAENVRIFSEPQKRDRLAQIVFHDTGEIRITQIENVTLDVESELVTVRLSFLDFAPLERVTRRESLAPSNLEVTIFPVGDEVYLGSFVQGVFWLFQTLEASRVVCQEILAALDTEERYTLRPPRVERLSLQSPFEALLQTDHAYVVLAAFVIGRLIAWRKKYYEGSVERQEARRLKWEQDQREAAARIDPQALRELAVQLIREQLIDSGASVGDIQSADEEKIDNVISKQIIPSASALVHNSEEVELSSDNELPNPDDEGDETVDEDKS